MDKPKQAQLLAPSIALAPPFPVVGIGASAGGLPALITLLEHMPLAPGMALVVVLHLASDYPSEADQLLQRVTDMSVVQVSQRMHILPNHVYVIPPGHSMTMEDGQLIVGELQRLPGDPVTIDIFLRTLAEAHKERSIAVILSGMGADGVAGLACVKGQGGVTIAQLPSNAEESSMPQSAIDSGMADFILTADHIPDKLVQLRDIAQAMRQRGAHGNPPDHAPAADVDPAPQEILDNILTVLHSRTGHDFRQYKQRTVLRRLERRLQVRAMPDLQSYLHLLQKDQSESNALLKDLLIGMTCFFRDRQAFASLQQEVLPDIFRGRRPEEHVRAWVAACSTGEEAYSLGILLSDQAQTMPVPPTIQIFASDIDEQAIAFARAGQYSGVVADDIPPSQLERYFTQNDAGEGYSSYKVRKSLRDRILFTRHNLLEDPAFSRLDLITCRNLLIYLNHEMHRQVLEMFHFALNPGGYLFLGSAESADLVPHLFTAVDPQQRIYQVRYSPRAARRLVVRRAGLDADGRRLVRVQSGEAAMHSANEDTQSEMEELRSAMESLETGREELQSRNEELQTVNTELKMKVDETSKAKDDLSNLVASTGIATLFLDREMRIKRYTPHVAGIFNVIPSDVGRPLYHITNKLDFPQLIEELRKVLITLRPLEQEVRSTAGLHYIVRVHPYRTAEDQIDGVVVTFFDISLQRNAMLQGAGTPGASKPMPEA